MTRIRIEKLVWNTWNKEHIKKHNLSQKEVEVAVCNVIVQREGYERRFILLGRSGTRIVAVIMRREKTGMYYIVTARDADKKERRLVYEKEKHK